MQVLQLINHKKLALIQLSGTETNLLRYKFTFILITLSERSHSCKESPSCALGFMLLHVRMFSDSWIRVWIYYIRSNNRYGADLQTFKQVVVESIGREVVQMLLKRRRETSDINL